MTALERIAAMGGTRTISDTNDRTDQNIWKIVARDAATIATI